MQDMPGAGQTQGTTPGCRFPVMATAGRLAARVLKLLAVSIVCVCGMLLTGAAHTPAAASEYFPDVLSCGSSPTYLVPPADVLAQAGPAPPTPLFAESFQSLAASVIAPRWLPDGFDDALYLEHGEGAYRAQTAHLCKISQRSGCTVILKGFAGGLVAIVEPMPVKVTPEVREALLEAAKHGDPCEYLSPYEKDGAPAAVVSLFASIRDELLSPAAHPVNADNWNRMVKGIGVVRGGLWLNYGIKGPINDPGFDPVAAANPWNYSVVIWTNGSIVTVALDRNNIVRSNLYRQLQPIVDISMEGLRLPYVSTIVTAGEWVIVGEAGQGEEIPEEPLVANREQASHQKLYFDLGDGLHWMALVHNPTTATEIEEAAWLCLARSALHRIGSCDYGYVDQEGSPREVLERLGERRARHLAALDAIEQAPCPGGLAATRDSLLSAFRVSKAIWEVAWPHWESALTNPPQGVVDYEALRATVKEEVASAGLPVRHPLGIPQPLGWGWQQCSDAIRNADTSLGIRTEDCIYEP